MQQVQDSLAAAGGDSVADSAVGAATSLAGSATQLVDNTVMGALDRLQEFVQLPIPVLSSLGSGDQTMTVGSVIGFFVALTLTFTGSRIIQLLIARGMLRRGIEDLGTIGTTQRLFHYVIVIIGSMVAIDILGFDLTALFAAGAVVAVGIGFAMQNILQNFVSGFILLIERTIKPADIIEVSGLVVRVEEMGIRATIVRTWDDEQIIIPNSTLVQGNVKNFTLRDDLYRLRTKVGVSYDSDLDRTREVLLEAAHAQPNQATNKEPVVLLYGFGDSSVLFDVSIWVNNPWTARIGRSDLNFLVWHALKRAGITIAYPQLDVHFDGPFQNPRLEGDDAKVKTSAEARARGTSEDGIDDGSDEVKGDQFKSPRS